MEPAPLPTPRLLPVTDPAATLLEAALDLPLHQGSCALARRSVRDWLSAWGVRDEDVRGDVLLVVSELVANAVLHGGVQVRLELALSGSVLAVGVSDGSSVLPEQRSVGGSDEGGRGIAIVAALAQDWGVEPAHGGKRVWVHLSV